MSNPKPETLDANSLYLEESFTDRQVGTLRRMTPVDRDGNPDQSRPVLYVGSAQVYTPAGALPLSFEIEAASLAEAADGFGSAAQKALEETMEELRRMQREQASSIVVPGQERGAGNPLGGKIQIP